MVSMAMADLKNTILNPVLCYVSSARDSFSQENIILSALAFFKPADVLKAKDIIIAKEKQITRRPCTDHPNPISADLKDIL